MTAAVAQCTCGHALRIHAERPWLQTAAGDACRVRDCACDDFEEAGS